MKTFERIPSKKAISGVAAGLAEYWDVDVALVRLGFVLGSVFVFPIFPIAYLVLTFVVPKRNEAFGYQVVEENKIPSDKKQNNQRTIGIVAIGLGVIFLLDEFVTWFSFGKLWPLVLIAVGLGIIFKDRIKNNTLA